MSININSVGALFSNLQKGSAGEFFKNVADDVKWKVMGTHPLAGIYYHKDSFLEHTFNRLNKILKEGVVLKIKNIIINNDRDIAVVEMESISTAINGKPFDNTYCWIVEFGQNQMITLVRAYVDSALVQSVIDENE